jgi:hypothetical protein
VLIDFGAARQAVGRRSRNITSIVTPGYAPLEQYTVEGNQGPWTDIYATGAVLYQILTGSAPPDATARARNDPYKPLGALTASPYSAQLREAIDWALRFDEADRPQSIAQWRDGLSGAIPIPIASPNDQVTRLVSADRQTVANPAAGRPGGRHSVLDSAAPVAAASAAGPISAGNTQVFSPHGAAAASRSNRAVIIAAVLGAVAVVAIGAAVYLVVNKPDIDPTKIAVVTPPVPAPVPAPTPAPAPKPPVVVPTPAPTPSPVPAPTPSQNDPKKGLDNPQKRSTADRLNLNPDQDKSVDKSKPFNPSEASLRAASQARDIAVDARRIAGDARNLAVAARERARIAHDEIAPAARKAATGPGAKTKTADSATFTGNLVNNKRQGLGVMVTTKGYRNEGQWDNDGATGLGSSVDANGDHYDGEWRNGDRHGRGVYSWASGQKFEGEYRDGARNGLGVLTQPIDKAEGPMPEHQECQWQDGKANGRGIIVFANGERYEGEFGDGKFNGRGVYTWTDGQRFEGSYQNDKRAGYGILYLKDGSRQSGFWDGTNLTRAD